jgi:flagellar assembly protein FliH
LIRAVRLLPGAVRVGRGGIEEIIPDGQSIDKSGQKERNAGEESPLAAAEAELRTLKSELRSREAELVETRSRMSALNSGMEAMKEELEAEKKAFYENATKEAEARKEASANEGREQGYAKGYADGLVKSEEDVRSEYEGRFADALKTLSVINDSLVSSREKLALQHTPQLIRLWEAVLQRMLHARVEMDSEAVGRVLEYILRRVSDRERIIICLNPADVSAVEGSKESLMDSIRGVKFFEILSDDHVDRGSCLIETNLGIYDARWRTQLEQVSSEVQGLIMECIAKDGGDDSGG